MGTTISPTLFFSLLALFSLLLLPSTTAIPETTISAAAEILSNAGYDSMSLTLPLISASLSYVPYATLFSPSDHAFSLSSAGQPSLSLLHFHFCPRIYSPADLLTLSYGAYLSTVLPNASLAVSSTINDDFVSLNAIKIGASDSPVFDNGFLTVYTVDDFFSQEFRFGDCRLVTQSTGSYWEASAALRKGGYSRMAGFLDVQVSQFDQGDTGRGKNVITVFAPRDEAMEGYLGNYSYWGSVFLRHVVGCKMSWGDLVALDDGVVLGTLLKGFGIKIGKIPDSNNMTLNGNFTVDFPDFYRSDRILVHGLSGILTEDDQEVSSGGTYTPNLDFMAASDHGEF